MATIREFLVPTHLYSWVIVAGLLLLAGYRLYLWALPKPIPGIPYNEAAVKRLFGDAPDSMAWFSKKSELFTFLTEQCIKHDSPIVQLFLRPLGKPWVIVTDYHEAQDIMTRRIREFDRSDFMTDIFYEPFPHHQIHFKTTDKWRAHRKLMADTMSASMLNNVASGHIHTAAMDMVNLFREKMRLANGHPFTVSDDIHRGVLDAIWAAAFGTDIGTTKIQLNLLAGLNQIPLPKLGDGAAIFPVGPTPEEFDCIITIANSGSIPMGSPVPRLHYRLALKLIPSLRKAMKRKDQLLQERLDAAWNKFKEDPDVSMDQLKSATELVVQREVQMAKKENRLPQYDTPDIKDELVGFLIAGHETTSTTLCWGLKFLTDHQEVQLKLRSELRAKLSAAHESGRYPSAQEIVKMEPPYLDATIEEVLRCGVTASSHMRMSTVDTELLGHHIPKGTDVFFMTNGPGYVAAPFDIHTNKRSTGSIALFEKTGCWDPETIGKFMPERWLVTDDQGQVTFSARAGPSQPFGAGPRSCFGRKLGMMNLKIVVTLIVWAFELQETPLSLSSYDGLDMLAAHMPQKCFVSLKEAK